MPEPAATADAAPPPAARSASPRQEGAFVALRYPGIRLIIVGTFFAFSGFWTFNVAQGWLVLEITDSPALVGIISACSNLPFLFVSVVAGVMADRADRKRLCLVSRTLVVCVMLLEAALYWSGAIEVWMMAALALCAGVGFSMDNPVRQSMVPDLVPDEHLANAIALTFASGNLTNIVGPSLGGVILATAGPGWSFFTTAVGNAILFTSYLFLRLPPRTLKASVGAWQQLREGVGFVRRDEVFYILIIAGAITGLVQPYLSLMPVFARDELGLGSAGLGVMLAAPGVGSLIGSLLVAWMGGSVRRGRLMFVGAFSAGAMLIVLMLMPSIYPALPVLSLVGISYAFFMTMNNTIVVQRAPEHLRGRVMSVMIVVWGLAPLGSIVAGSVATATGVRVALGAMAAWALVVVASVFIRRPSLRRL